MSNSFFERGGAWVVGQFALLATVAVLAPLFQAQRHWGFVIAGAILILIAVVVAIAGKRAIGRNFTALPNPGQDAQLVQSGIYGRVRHPLYAAVILLSLGWVLMWRSLPGAIAWIVVVAFFVAKAHCEEKWLLQRFPQYAEYRERVKRFIPWVW